MSKEIEKKLFPILGGRLLKRFIRATIA